MLGIFCYKINFDNEEIYTNFKARDRNGNIKDFSEDQYNDTHEKGINAYLELFENIDEKSVEKISHSEYEKMTGVHPFNE